MPRIGRILCPIDFSETSCHAVEQATAITGSYRARLSVLHAYGPIFMPAVFGWTTAQVVRRATCPVVTLRR